MKQIDISHHIQRRIFNRLVGAESMRYSELKPKELEANAFMYHLNELIKAGLVEKQDKQYQLTETGKALATRFSIRESGIRLMPTTLSVIYLHSQDEQTLLYRRKRQPYIDALGFPSGKIHLGETLEEAAYRELEEKCGYQPKEVKLTLKGEFSLVSRRDKFIENHVIGHLWEGMVIDKKTHTNHAGETYWADWQAEDYSQFIPGFKELIEASKQSNQFVLDLKFD
ncbi:NUDIX domain-containing protein [Candidatus Saccharibacteria bacterium]|nr:NUDIX domain-containing protein [Candidatus Saccharibacteria bacterium]MCB9821702.1 NUDIX domain-containing protein [Candidatus Nomurabacteria bacterium]